MAQTTVLLCFLSMESRDDAVKGKPVIKELIICCILMPIAALLIYLLIVRLFFSTTPNTFKLSKDHILLSYYSFHSDATDELLGKCEPTDSDTLSQVYSIKDLPDDSYFLLRHGTPMPGGLLDELYMKNDTAEPIMCYDVQEIVILPVGEISLSDKVIITKKDVINEFLSVRRNSKANECAEPMTMNTQIKFDSESEMIFSCNIVTDDQGHIMLECFDVAQSGWYCYDVTLCLQDFITSK